MRVEVSKDGRRSHLDVARDAFPSFLLQIVAKLVIYK
jgi:hypothetical protein